MRPWTRRLTLITALVALRCYAGDAVAIDDFVDPELRNTLLCLQTDDSTGGPSSTDPSRATPAGSAADVCEAKRGTRLNLVDGTFGHVSNYQTLEQITGLDSDYASVYSRHYFDRLTSKGTVVSQQLVGGFTRFFDEHQGAARTDRVTLRAGWYSLLEEHGRDYLQRMELRLTHDHLDGVGSRSELAWDFRLNRSLQNAIATNLSDLTLSYFEDVDGSTEFRLRSNNEIRCPFPWCSRRRTRLVGALGIGAGYGEGDLRWLPFTVGARFEWNFRHHGTLFTSYSYSYQPGTARFVEESSREFAIGVYTANSYGRKQQ